MSEVLKKGFSINLNFKQKYAEGLLTPKSPFSGTPKSLSREEQIKLILKKNSNERTTQDIILLSQQIEGDIGEKFYIILEGQVAVIINVQSKKKGVEQREIGKLITGESFGDLALLFNSIRNATIKLDKKSTFIVLRKEIFQKYIKYKTPPNAHEILKFYDQFILYPYQLDLPEKIQILSKTEQTNYISNSLIIRQGQLISSLFFIKKGVVKINPITKQILPLDYSDPTPQEIADKQYKEISLEIDEIYEGCVFSDYELFKQIKSTVSIVAYTPCEILQIQREDMVVLPTKMNQDLLNETKAYPDDYKLRRIYLEGLQWLKYKNVVVEGVCRENTVKKKLQNSVNFFSRSTIHQPSLQPHLVCLEDSFTQDTAQGDVQQIENKFFGQYNQQMNKRSLLGGMLSTSSRTKINFKSPNNTKYNLMQGTKKEKQEVNKEIENDQKNEFIMNAERNSFYIQDENDFVKFDEELQEIEIEDEKSKKKTMYEALMRQLDPNTRTTLSQKKLPQKYDKKANGKSLTLNSNKQSSMDYELKQKHRLSPKFHSTYSPKLQSISSEIFKFNKKNKSSKQILPKITNQIQYLAQNEDIICQNSMRQINKFKDQSDNFTPF